MRTIAHITSVAVFLSGCAAAPPVASPATTQPAEPADSWFVSAVEPGPPDPSPTTYDGFTATLADPPTLVAIARGETEVFSGPGAADPVETVPATTVLGTTTVLTSLGNAPVGGRLEVMLPGRPNGRTGWIDTDRVDLYAVSGRIVVDLSDRALTYYVGDTAVMTVPVAVGSDRSPTPTGSYYITDSVTVTDPNGPWGPHAFGLSARSDTITEFNGGDGIIGLHGTNKPDSIGNAASLGCVRLPNDAMADLHRVVPLGTPVEIRA